MNMMKYFYWKIQFFMNCIIMSTLLLYLFQKKLKMHIDSALSLAYSKIFSRLLLKIINIIKSGIIGYQIKEFYFKSYILLMIYS